jgi:acylphosphatase
MKQTEGAYIAEVMKLMGHVQSNEDTTIQIVRTHQHHTYSTLLQIFKNFKNYFQVK